MANTLLLKRSAVANKVPTTSDLALGELGLNTYDGKLYLKRDNGTAAIVEVAVKDSSGNLGIGTAPSARLHLLSTTEQLRAAYDASNYATLTVGSTGVVTFDAAGTSTSYRFAKDVTVNYASTPVAKLSVAGAENDATIAVIHSADTSFRLRTVVGSTTASALIFKQGLYYASTENASINFYRGGGTNGGYLTFATSDGSERLRIDSSGNVAVGTTSASARLHLVSTTEQLRLGYDASNYVKLTVGSTGGVTLDAVGSGAKFTFSDNVGVGATPSAWTSGFNSVEIGAAGSGIWGYSGGNTGSIANAYYDGTSWKYAQTGYAVYTDIRKDDGEYRWYSAASGTAGASLTWTERMRLDGSGNLGIGATASARLHVQSTTEQLRVGYDASNYLKVTVGSTGISTYDAVGSGAKHVFSDPVVVDGSYLQTVWNATTVSTLESDVDGVMLTSYKSTGANLRFITTSTGGVNTERMRIDSAGNVGIGTTSASARLHLVRTTEQLRVGYDASNYFNMTVGSTGGVIYNAAGTGAKHSFYDQVEVANANGGAVLLTSGPTTSNQVPDIQITRSGTASYTVAQSPCVQFQNTTSLNSFLLQAPDGDLQFFSLIQPSGWVERARLDKSGNLGIGTTASARLHLLSTTEQLRVGYDASNYFKATVGSTGTVTLDAVGSGAGFTFNDAITIDSSSTQKATFGGSYIELGGTSFTPYIDWHSSAAYQDYDVRMIVFGDNTSSGRGQLRTYCESSWWTTLANANGHMMLSRNAGYEHGLALATFETSWRWFLAVNSTAESGSNAGSNFAIRRFDDAGASLGDVFFIRRSDGQIGIGTSSPTVPLDVNGVIKGTQLRGGYNDTTASANTAAQALGTNTVSRVLISASTTLTTTVPPAGAYASVIIQTSGTVSRTVTFGTGFKSQGTLATGAVADRYWVVNFVSDGTSLYETSRTTTAYA